MSFRSAVAVASFATWTSCGASMSYPTARMRSEYWPGPSFQAGNRYRPCSSLTTVTVIVDSTLFALTSTPSIAPSSADITTPVRAAGDDWFWAPTVRLRAIISKKIRFTIVTSYFPSTENARRTLPGMLPSRAYPELTNNIPPTTTAPGPFNEPPVALTPLTVWYSRTVSKSHTILPSSEEYARRWPSSEPEKTTPGIAVTACDCAGLHPGFALAAQTIGGENQTFSPFAIR